VPMVQVVVAMPVPSVVEVGGLTTRWVATQ